MPGPTQLPPVSAQEPYTPEWQQQRAPIPLTPEAIQLTLAFLVSPRRHQPAGAADTTKVQTLFTETLKSALPAAMRSELLRGVGHGGALVSSATNGAGSLVYNHYGH